jgi:hypothetical protein
MEVLALKGAIMRRFLLMFSLIAVGLLALAAVSFVVPGVLAGGAAGAKSINPAATASTVSGAHSLRPAQGKQHIARHTSYTTNWSGYVSYSDTFTDVKGSWVQPAANCTGISRGKQTVASFWAGLDGWNSKTVEQTGVDAECIGSTKYHIPWVEFYPAGPISLSHTVKAIDHLTAEVSQNGSTVTTKLTDAEQGWTDTRTASASGLLFNSAEWIVEGPTQSLTNFGSVTFGSATATDADSKTGPIDSSTWWSYDSVVMVTSSGGAAPLLGPRHPRRSDRWQ